MRTNKRAKAIRDMRKENCEADKIPSDKRTLFKSKNETIRDIRRENYDAEKIFMDMRTEVCYKPIITGNTFSSNYIEYESNGDKGKTLLIEDYLNKIKPYLIDLINYLKTQGEWIMGSWIIDNGTYFYSSKDSKENPTIYSKSDNTEILIGNETDEIIKELFDSLLQRYKKN